MADHHQAKQIGHTAETGSTKVFAHAAKNADIGMSQCADTGRKADAAKAMAAYGYTKTEAGAKMPPQKKSRTVRNGVANMLQAQTATIIIPMRRSLRSAGQNRPLP